MVKFQYLIIVLHAIVLVACNHDSETNNDQQSSVRTNKIEKDSWKKTEQTTHNENSRFYTSSDTIKVISETAGTLKYSKEEFNWIIDSHPELFTVNTEDVDRTYYCKGNSEEFAGEAGQDSYYILYAYFLKHKNGTDKYSNQRKKLIEIYLNINTLFGQFEYGGTYFGHQKFRIPAYAEYSVYLYSLYINDFEKKYDITKQKEIYIKSLRQLITDESSIDNETTGSKKDKRTKDLNKIVDNLEGLISDIFYLRRAQEFHYENYEYY